MAVKGEEIRERKDDYYRLATTTPIVAVASGPLPGTQCSFSALANGGISRELKPPRGSSSSPSTASLSSDDGMNMRFAELTHLHLKNSIHQINDKYHLSDADFRDTHLPRQSTSSVVGSVSNGTILSSRSTHSSKSSVVGSTKFQSLLSVKDALLEEKEATIVKLRLEVSSMQHQMKESNATLRQLLRGKQSALPAGYSFVSNGGVNHDMVNGSESSTRMEALMERDKSIDQLKSVLGKTECQLADAAKEAAREKRILENKISELEMCLREKDKIIVDYKKKNKSLLEKIEKYKRRVESLERYLGDLPTMEESRALKKTVENLLTDRETLAGDLERITHKYVEIAPVLEEKENYLRAESENNVYLKGEIEKLSAKISDLEKAHVDLEPSERQELEQKKRELIRIKRENEDAANLVSAADKRIETLTAQHQQEIARLQEKIEEEENASQALKRELSGKQQASTKLQSAMAKLASQNQQLMEEKMSFLEQLRTLERERSTAKDSSRVITRLYNETHIAVKDIEAVAQVLLQTAKGDDPNLSALLGVRSSSVGVHDVEDEESEPSVETATRRLSDIRKLRCDIDELRSTLSNRYAENIGQNCATQ